MVAASAVEHIFNESAMFTHTHAQAMTRKADRRVYGPRVLAKYKGKTSKTGLSGPENPKSVPRSEAHESAQTYHTDNSYTDKSCCDDGWSYDEWNDDWSSVGWQEGWDQTFDNSASSLSLEVLILVP